jgi:phage gpG-like protein
MIGVKVSTKGLDEMRRKIVASKLKLSQNVPLTDYIASRAYKECMTHFQDQQGPEGAWKDLAESTKAARRQGKRKGHGVKILQDTGRLKGSILFRGYPDKAIVFTNVQYGITHQDGTNNIPQRKFLWVDNPFLKEMADKYAKFVKGDLS